MPTLTGIVGRPAGQIVPLANTTKRSKWLDIPLGSITGSPALTSLPRARALFYVDSNNSWRMRFNIAIKVASAARTSGFIDISGVGFYNVTAGYQAVATQATDNNIAVTSFTGLGSGRISYSHASSTESNYTFSGDVELNAEPTWASLGTTWTAIAEVPGDVTAYIPNADASTTGLLTAGAQTVGGVKTFSNSPKLTAATGIDYSLNTPAAGATSQLLNWYEEGTFTPYINGSTSAGVGTYVTQAGRYTRIGRLVFIQAAISWTAHTGTGNINVGGFPYTVAATSGIFGISGVVDISNLTVSPTGTVFIETLNSTTGACLAVQPSAGGSVTLLAMDTAASIWFNLTYTI